MSTRRVKNESFDNLHRVTGVDEAEAVTALDIVMADAVQDNDRTQQHVDDVAEQLKKKAEVVSPEAPEEAEPPVKNEFTAKLVLDESLVDFQLTEATKQDGRANKVYEDDDEDEYLDYDMFDFVYGLVTDCYPKPLDPLGRKRYRKFMYIGSDKYKDSPDSETRDTSDGHAQVASSGDTIEVYSNDATHFDDVSKILDIYKIKYVGPNLRRSKNTYWKFSWKIEVPCISSGYPYMVEDYFEQLDLSMEDVMPKAFCDQYRKRQAALDKESSIYINDAEVEKVVNQAITAAAQDNTEPLTAHLKRLYSDLDASGLKYKKSDVKSTFMKAFEDDDDEDDEDID